jgi:peptidoglycan/LPS O-acetylase OafA/YrhL
MTKRSVNIEIEYLRAYAIILVLISHFSIIYRFFDFIPEKYFYKFSFGVGVDLFFCISGYVVSKSLSNLYKIHPNSMKLFLFSFYKKRFYRLFPAALVWIFLGILFTILYNISINNKYNLYNQIFFNKYGLFPNINQSFCSAGFFFLILSNISFIFNCSHPFETFWSLSLEEQFYLFFPLLFFSFRNKIKILKSILIILILSSIIIKKDPFGSFYEILFFNIRFDGFSYGCLLFIFQKNFNLLKIKYLIYRYLKLYKFIFFPLLIFLLIENSTNFLKNINSISYISLISSIIVFLSIYRINFIPNIFISKRIILWISSRSYSIYLSHFLIFKFLNLIFLLYGFEINIYYSLFFYISTTFIASEITYKLIEEKYRL